MICDHVTPELVRMIGINGNSYVFERCSHCFIRLGTSFLPHNGDVDDIPVVEDRRLDVPPCRRCGERGTELHHWAPRAFFDDADIWPQDWLCRACHTKWHQIMTSARPAELATS